MAITVTKAITTTSTLNVTSYASGAFTPAASDQLLVFVVASATVAAGSMTDSQSLGWTRISSTAWDAGVDTLYCFLANTLAAASSMTVTFDCTGDSATGTVISVYRIAGAKTPAGTYKQIKAAFSDVPGNIPTVIMDAAFSSANCGIGAAVVNINPAGISPILNWTEVEDTGFATPDTGMEVCNRISGETLTTIAWGAVVASEYGAIVVEFEPAAAGGGGPAVTIKTHKLLLGNHR